MCTDYNFFNHFSGNDDGKRESMSVSVVESVQMVTAVTVMMKVLVKAGRKVYFLMFLAYAFIILF